MEKTQLEALESGDETRAKETLSKFIKQVSPVYMHFHSHLISLVFSIHKLLI